MTGKMLIDASHREETRIVVLRDGRIKEFDFETARKTQLKGNIYLAKVMRVEPSLQAAFVDYGGNRHGFLTFSEIHPDYYQSPVADRQPQLAEIPAEAEAEAEADTGDDSSAVSPDENGEDLVPTVESHGQEDALDEIPERVHTPARDYKIQEVIKRRQILLVQIVKEERGTKGAALTTYISMAGRYAVLMPNTARGGGISRKVSNTADRKRLKKIAQELSVPEGMGVILRTAGANRTKGEIKRDFEYLLRHWDKVRDTTLKSIAPDIVFEEGSLIQRSIRDLYDREISEVLVSGDEGYREAKDLMKMLMPSHAKQVQPWRERTPIFSAFNVERELARMYQNEVPLKSGGYLVINSTEALVAIDVNSGKSTREHSIEETAFQTNLEAAEEIAYQLRLRDLAGLIVADFIDMSESRHNRAVERRLKDSLKSDRARIQVGRISHFGLLEMSRQRLHSGILESTTSSCPHCNGSGLVRSVESISLQILRETEEYLLANEALTHIDIASSPEVALYMLNHKRAHLQEIENRFPVTIAFSGAPPANEALFTIRPAAARDPASAAKEQAPARQPEQEQREKADRPRQRGGRGQRGRDTEEGARKSKRSTMTENEKSASSEAQHRAGRNTTKHTDTADPAVNGQIEAGTQMSQAAADSPGEALPGNSAMHEGAENAGHQLENGTDAAESEQDARTGKSERRGRPRRRMYRRQGSAAHRAANGPDAHLSGDNNGAAEDESLPRSSSRRGPRRRRGARTQNAGPGAAGSQDAQGAQHSQDNLRRSGGDRHIRSESRAPSENGATQAGTIQRTAPNRHSEEAARTTPPANAGTKPDSSDDGKSARRFSWLPRFGRS